MTYSLVLTSRAKRAMKPMSREVQNRILNALERLSIRPFSHVVRVVGSPYYRFKIGKYRAVVEIQKKILIVYVIDVANRETIYQRLRP